MGSKIRDNLNRAPVTVPPQCSCREAACLMGREDVGALLVVEAGQLVGIVTDRDLAVRALATGAPPETPVSELMTPDPVTVQGGADLEDALELFAENGVRRLPVLEDSEVAGIISLAEALTDSLADLPPMILQVL